MLDSVGMTAQPPAEGSLLRAAIDGDAAAFNRLFEPLLEPAYRLAQVMLDASGRTGSPEDAVQEAAFKAWRRLSQLRGEDVLRAWFMTIVANECRSMRRHRWWTTLRLPSLPERAASRDEEGVVRDLDLARSFARLEPDDRLVVYLFFYDDRPLEDIAQILRVSVAAARSRLYRAVGRLRPGLEAQEVITT